MSRTLQQEGCSSCSKHCWITCQVSSEMIKLWKCILSNLSWDDLCHRHHLTNSGRKDIPWQQATTLTLYGAYWIQANLHSFDLSCYLCIGSISGFNTEWRILSLNLNQLWSGSWVRQMKPQVLVTGRGNVYKLFNYWGLCFQGILKMLSRD